jgi:6-pyruvoyltetrahydropterin/6-carboxytetrahydropterin synthase
MSDWKLCRIAKRYAFEAAHRLPKVPDWHKCHNLHGHNYEVEIEIRGEISSASGFCGGWDFFELDRVVNPLIKIVDHKYLNQIEGLENPTAELIAAWFLCELNKTGAFYFSVTVWETRNCWAQVVNKDGYYQKEHRE